MEPELLGEWTISRAGAKKTKGGWEENMGAYSKEPTESAP